MAQGYQAVNDRSRIAGALFRLKRNPFFFILPDSFYLGPG
jgi:hypothetical protein